MHDIYIVQKRFIFLLIIRPEFPRSSHIFLVILQISGAYEVFQPLFLAFYWNFTRVSLSGGSLGPCVDSGSWWWTGRPGVLRFLGSQRVGHDWVTELNWPFTGTSSICAESALPRMNSRGKHQLSLTARQVAASYCCPSFQLQNIFLQKNV